MSITLTSKDGDGAVPVDAATEERDTSGSLKRPDRGFQVFVG